MTHGEQTMDFFCITESPDNECALATRNSEKKRDTAHQSCE